MKRERSEIQGKGIGKSDLVKTKGVLSLGLIA